MRRAQGHVRTSRGSLVATDVDGDNILEAEVPFQVGLHKWGYKATTGGIHMDFDIISLQSSRKHQHVLGV